MGCCQFLQTFRTPCSYEADVKQSSFDDASIHAEGCFQRARIGKKEMQKWIKDTFELTHLQLLWAHYLYKVIKAQIKTHPSSRQVKYGIVREFFKQLFFSCSRIQTILSSTLYLPTKNSSYKYYPLAFSWAKNSINVELNIPSNKGFPSSDFQQAKIMFPVPCCMLAPLMPGVGSTLCIRFPQCLPSAGYYASQVVSGDDVTLLCWHQLETEAAHKMCRHFMPAQLTCLSPA